MQASLRKTLIESHVAAVALAVLSFICVEEAFFAVSYPANLVVSFLIDAATNRTLPGISRTLDLMTRQNLLTSITHLIFALANTGAIWLFSRWVYGASPLRVLGNYREKLARKTNA